MPDDYESIPTLRTRHDEPIMPPEHYLWQAMMDIAGSRVDSVLKFAREWRDIRFDMDYPLRRVRCLFHLSWLFDDTDSARFTFRQLCQFSQADDLRNVKLARERIMRAFSKECLDSLAKPVDEGMWKRVATAWVGYGPGVKTQTRARKPVRETEQDVEHEAEDTAVTVASIYEQVVSQHRARSCGDVSGGA